MLRQQKGSEGGLENGQFCWRSVLYSVFMLTKWVGGPEKVQNYADVIYDGPLAT